jgi:hypothetical protein
MYGYRMWFNDLKYIKMHIYFVRNFPLLQKEFGKGPTFCHKIIKKRNWINVTKLLFQITIIDSQ